MSTPTALLYSRVSTDDQARDGISLDAQVNACRQYAVGKGWILGREYQDVMSGREDQRPGYRELLEDVRRLRAEGKAVVVTVAALDRFGRKLIERVRARQEFVQLGVSVHAIREGGEVPGMVADYLAAVAEEESARLGQRVREVRNYIVAQGWAPVGRLPWGYRWRDATDDERKLGAPLRVPCAVEAEAPYVLELFQRIAAGESIRQATQWVQRLPEVARGGRVLDYKSVRVTLYSPAVIARMPREDGGDPVVGRVMRWPAIVSDELWGSAHQKLALGRHLGRQASGAFLLSGIVRCPRCGTRMAGRNRERASQRRYRCNALNSKQCALEVPSRLVDEAVLAAVSEIIERAMSAEFRPLLRDAWERLRAPSEKDTTAAQIATAEAASSKARARLVRVGTQFVDGEIPREHYDELRLVYEADLEAAETELTRLRGVARQIPTLLPFDQVMSDMGSWAEILNGVDTLARRDAIGEMVETVTPEPTGKRGRYRMHYTWTARGDALRRLGDAIRQAQ